MVASRISGAGVVGLAVGEEALWLWARDDLQMTCVEGRGSDDGWKVRFWLPQRPSEVFGSRPNVRRTYPGLARWKLAATWAKLGRPLWGS